MDNEVFKDITIKGLTYKVSNYGRIFGSKKELKQRLNQDGYCVVTLGKLEEKRSTFFVARLVGMLFVDGYKDDMEINHKDFCRTNNYYENLEWVTHQENIKHSHDNNYDVFFSAHQGENNGRAVYTKEQVDKMRQLHEQDGLTTMEIVKYFYPDADFKFRKKRWSRINDIINYKTWKNENYLSQKPQTTIPLWE